MWYDVLTVCILTYATFRGAMKGIVWQLAAIASLLLSFFFAGSLSGSVADYIRVEPPLNGWIAMFLLYLGFSFVSFGLARVLREGIETMRIEALDRHLGALLGLFKGGVFSLFLTFFLVTLSASARESITESESGYVAAVVIDRFAPVLPGNLHALLEPYIERLDTEDIEREHLERRRLNGDQSIADLPREQRERLSREEREDFDHRGRRDVADRPGADEPFDRTDPDEISNRADRGRGRLDDRELPDRRRQDLREEDEITRPRNVRRRPPSDADLRDSGRETSETDWISAIPVITGELKALALKAWKNTRAEHRPEFRRRLSGSVPERVPKTIREWENGRPSTMDEADVERSDLERDIVQATAGTGDNADDAITVRDIERSLRGIPDDVAINVLRDWRADLRGENTDPDSRTTARTNLNERIRLQLSKAGISIRSLDTATQDRLRRSETR